MHCFNLPSPASSSSLSDAYTILSYTFYFYLFNLVCRVYTCGWWAEYEYAVALQQAIGTHAVDRMRSLFECVVLFQLQTNKNIFKFSYFARPIFTPVRASSIGKQWLMRRCTECIYRARNGAHAINWRVKVVKNKNHIELTDNFCRLPFFFCIRFCFFICLFAIWHGAVLLHLISGGKSFITQGEFKLISAIFVQWTTSGWTAEWNNVEKSIWKWQSVERGRLNRESFMVTRIFYLMDLFGMHGPKIVTTSACAVNRGRSLSPLTHSRIWRNPESVSPSQFVLFYFLFLLFMV